MALLWILAMPGSVQHQRANAAPPMRVSLVEPPPKRAEDQVFLTVPAEPKPVVREQPAPKGRQLARTVPPVVPELTVRSAPPLTQPVAAHMPDAGTVAQYRLLVLAAARRFKHYPDVAVENNWQGKVEIRMAVDASGEVAALNVRTSAGHEVLDQHALETIERAKAIAQIPPALRGKAFAVDIPMVFSLREAGG